MQRIILLLSLILSALLRAQTPTPTPGCIINATSGNEDDVVAAINEAQDGCVVVVPSTVNLPGGAASWTYELVTPKSITLQGQTQTFLTASYPDTATADDQTIILDDLPRPGARGMLMADMGTSTRAFRLTGFTFKHGASPQYQNGQGAIALKGGTLAAPNYSMRVDHCHFDNLYATDVQNLGVCYGVADHNLHDAAASEESYYMTTADNNDGGDGVWADYPYFGTPNFFFIEDNTIRGKGEPASGAIDAQVGARFIPRHNVLMGGAHLGGHGTEVRRTRGMRASERYSNVIEVVNVIGIVGRGTARSGTIIEHDEVVVTNEPNAVCRFQVFREDGASGNGGGLWTSADGRSPWDMNDTDGQGHYTEGQPPYLFTSGISAGTTNEGTQARLSDPTQHWIRNQFVGCSVTDMNPIAACFQMGSYIISNTQNTITYYCYCPTGINCDRGPRLWFGIGDRYEVHRVLAALDQSGRGKGDRITGRRPINTRTGHATWPLPQQEPSISWNNTHQPSGHVLGFASADPSIQENRDYYNLGTNINGTPQLMSNTYNAATNGVQYVGPYVYPHPLNHN